MRTLVFAASLVVIGTSASFASSLSPGDIGDTFCAARVSGDMTSVTPLFSPKLAAAIADTEAKNADIAWQGVPDHASQCVVIGSSGTLENPEAVLFYQGSASWSDRLVLTFVDGELRIDDIIYAGGGRLTGTLTEASGD